jgi:hypothetical protein
VIQRIAGSVGTALLAVVLQRSIADNVSGLEGGLGGIAALSPEQRAQAAPGLADAFGSTFWVALALVAAALVPALLLPRLRTGVDAPRRGNARGLSGNPGALGLLSCLRVWRGFRTGS